MSKYRVLGIVNLLLSAFLIVILANSGYSKVPFVSLESFIHAYALIGILLFSLGMHAFLVYKLLSKKTHKLAFYLYLLLTFSTLFWFLLLFIGSFFASNIIFPIIALTLTIAVFYFLRKSSIKIATILSLITLLVSIAVIISGFEEDYCWEKGTEADNTGSKMVVATKEDAEALKGYAVKERAQISVDFRTHMLCHTTFSLTKALKEKYSFTK